MTRAARRAIPALLAVLTATLLSLALFAGPAAAADDQAPGTTEATSGFGTGQWDGMLLAAGAGVLMGILVFAMSKPGEIHRADDHGHQSPKGDQQMAP